MRVCIQIEDFLLFKVFFFCCLNLSLECVTYLLILTQQLMDGDLFFQTPP